MRLLKSTRGISLLELSVAIGIGSLLLAAALAGQAGLRRSTAFSSAVDKAKNQLQGFKAEATQNISVRPGASTGNSSQTVFGRLVEYDPSSDASRKVMHVSTLVSSSDRTALSKCDTQDIPFESGIQYKGATKQAVIFTGNPERAYIAPANYTTTPLANSPSCNSPGYTAPSTDGLGSLAPACGDSTHTLINPGNSPYGVCQCPGALQENPANGNHCEAPSPYPRPVITSPHPNAVIIGNTVTVSVSALHPGNTVTVKAGTLTCTPSPAVATTGNMDFTCNISTLGATVTITATQTNNFGNTSPADSVNISHFTSVIGPPTITSAVSDGAYVVMRLTGTANTTYTIYECTSSSTISDATCASLRSRVSSGIFDASGRASVRFKSSSAGTHRYAATQSNATGESAPSNIISVATYAYGSGGLTGNYYRNGAHVRSFPNDQLGSGFTYPDWYGRLITRTNARSFGDYELVFWNGYIKPDRSDTYRVCMIADDGAYVDIDGGRYVSDWPGGGSSTTICGGQVSLSTNSYTPISIGYDNVNFYGASAAFALVFIDSSGTFMEVPNSWFYYDTPFASAMIAPGDGSLVASLSQHEENVENQILSRLNHLVDGLKRVVVSSPARAAAICDTNILNPNNYNSACFGANTSATIELEVPGESAAGYLDIRHDDNSIERRVVQ